MEHIELDENLCSTNSMVMNYDNNGEGYLIIVDINYWTVKRDGYGVSGSSWTEVDVESFDFSISIYDDEENELPSDFLSQSEIDFIGQECINYLNDEYV